jgi:4-alpha-glucanotransferase
MSPVADGLARLGVRRLLLGLPQGAFPYSEGEDLGTGSPYSAAARRLVDRVRDLGFTGLQLSPPGRTSPVNASPYDGSLFARHEHWLSGKRLLEDPLCDGVFTEEWLGSSLQEARRGLRFERDVVRHASTWTAHRRWLDDLHRTLSSARTQGRAAELVAAARDFARTNADWLDGERDRASGLVSSAEPMAIQQFLVHRQHTAFHDELRERGMELWGDLQVGVPPQEEARYPDAFLRSYRMGAPPSRTNPAGQAWNFPVFDPLQLTTEGAARRLFAAFLAKLSREFDGLRIDHPHAWVCPWVYRPSDAQEGEAPEAAVRRGARLFESPQLPDHPELARLARVTPDQLNPDPACPRYADDWVVALTDEDVDVYAALMRHIVSEVGGAEWAACEVLSTEPVPLRRVRQRLGLGRFLVTQKADPTRTDDVYRSEGAARKDWVMIGNHDTPTYWGRMQTWSTARRSQEVRQLAERLRAPDFDAERWERDDGSLAAAKLADLFASPAENVVVFFGDLYGLREPYNRPGIVAPENWSQRVPGDGRPPPLELELAVAYARRAVGVRTPT